MHPLLQPILPTGITIVLWCVCSAATALVQPVKNNDPPPQHQPEPTAFITVVRTIPILKELAFEDRWRSSVERLAENCKLPHDFIAAGPLRPSPLTGVDNQALPDEVLDRFLNQPLYFGVCRPIFSWHVFSWHVFSWHILIPVLVLSLSVVSIVIRGAYSGRGAYE